MSVGVTKRLHATGGRSTTEVTNGVLTGSLFGVEGSDSLDALTKLFFKVESGVAPDTGVAGAGGRFFNRFSYLGLKRGNAELSFGRLYPAHIDRVVSSLDVYSAGGNAHSTPLALLGTNRYSGVDARSDNSARLSLGGPGWQGAISASASEGRGGQRAAELAHVGQAQTLAAIFGQYRAPDTAVHLGERPQQIVMGIGGNWKMRAFDVFAVGLRVRLKPAAGLETESHRVLAIGVAKRVGAWLFRSSITADHAERLGGLPGRSGSKTTWVGSAEYFLSRRSRIFSAVTTNHFDDAYQAEPLNIAALGRDPAAASATTLSLGVRHSF